MVEEHVECNIEFILYFIFLIFVLVLVKSNITCYVYDFLTLTSVAHYQLFLYLNRNVEICVYNRSVIRFMPCGTIQIKGQRSRGQRFNGLPKLNVRAQVTCPRLNPAMSCIETSLLYITLSLLYF